MEAEKEETVQVINVKQIESDFAQGLHNANFSESEKNQTGPTDIPKPRLDLNSLTVKSIYKVKKMLQLKVLSKDVPEAIKPKLSHLTKVEDREAEIVKRVLDHYGSDNLSPEMIEMINKYINTPIWPLIEMELELHEKMKADIKVIVETNRDEK